MFYAEGTTWKFRFTGTRLGTWTFTTTSSDSDLAGQAGTIIITPNPDPSLMGFVTNIGNKWVRQMTEDGQVTAFVPQLVMVNGPQGYYPVGWFTFGPGAMSYAGGHLQSGGLMDLKISGFSGTLPPGWGLFPGGLWDTGLISTNGPRPAT